MRLWRIAAALGILAAAAEAQETPAAAPGHWPGWRGPQRDGVSTETGLLREWPKEGPPLLWKASGVGEGMGCLSVAGGLIFVQGNLNGKDVVSALDGSGKIRWSSPLGPASGEHPVMRYVTQRSPTVDDGRLFATTWAGMVNCLESTTGRILWRKSLKDDLKGRATAWGYGDAPLIDGDLLICGPGGANGTLAALNKANGDVVWQSSGLKDMINASPVPAEIGGVRQVVIFTYDHIAGVSPRDGKVLWQADRRGTTAVVTPPVIRNGIVLVSSGFGVGCNAFKVTATGGEFKVQELYSGKQLENHHGGMVPIGDHVYATDQSQLKCVELKTGTVVWQDRCVGKGSVIAADGLLFVRSEQGPIALVEATPDGYREKGRFRQPERTKDQAHTHLVIAGGRMYVRDQDTLFCYDVRGSGYKAPTSPWNILGGLGKGSKGPSLPPAPGRVSDAAFVPTPADVVEKMLELAKVAKEDQVYDLGSGDGRIVIAASKKFGCASVGIEIEPELIRVSRQKAKDAGVEALVTLVEKDLFTADFSKATVVTLYLGESNNTKLLPKLRALKAGTRIVSHQHLLGPDGPKPDRTVTMKSSEDGSDHTIHLWTAPLAK